MLQLFTLIVCGKTFHVKHSPFFKMIFNRKSITQLFWLPLIECNCFGCSFGWPYKRAKPTKRPFMAAKLYHPYIALSRVFAEIFQKFFSTHYAHNPKTRYTFVFHRVRQKQGYFKLPPFLLLRWKWFWIWFWNWIWKWFSIWKLILNLILNLKMFHVTRKRGKGETWNLITKSPFMGRKLYHRDSVLSRTFFKKLLGVFAARVPKRKGSPRGAQPNLWK